MAKRRIADTVRAGLLPGASVLGGGSPRADAYAPTYRRETTVRRLIEKYGDPLEVIARAQLGDTSVTDAQLAAAKALAPYCYPTLKGVELSSADGTGVNVNILKQQKKGAP